MLCADNMLTEMQHWRHGPDSRQVHRGSFVAMYGFFVPEELQVVKETFDRAVEPTLRRITNVRDAVMEIQWWMFVMCRQYDYFKQYGYYQRSSDGEERLPTVRTMN